VDSAVQALQSTAAGSAASILEALDEASSPDPSSAPVDSGFFGLPGTQTSSGANGAPLLVGIILALGMFLLRRDGRLWRVSYEQPKPNSALLLPLERPG
jgi:hypothetical protein